MTVKTQSHGTVQVNNTKGNSIWDQKALKIGTYAEEMGCRH